MIHCYFKILLSTDNNPRKTVALTIKISEQVHLETLKDFNKRKKENLKEILKVEQSILDLKKVISIFELGNDFSLDEIFELNDFMIGQKLLIPAEMLKFSVEKFESQLQKSLTRLSIKIDNLKAKENSLTSIIFDHKNSKISTVKKVARAKLGKSNAE